MAIRTVEWSIILLGICGLSGTNKFLFRGLIKWFMLINSHANFTFVVFVFVQFINIKIYVKDSKTCDEGSFWVQCHGNEMCVCINNTWYQSSKSEVQKVNQGEICSCPGETQLDICTSPWLFRKIMNNSEFNETLVLKDEETCSQLLTRGSTTFSSTEKHETTFVTAINEQSVQEEASGVGESTTYQSTEKHETIVTAINEETIQDEVSSVAMCPCSCEYFDKIEYWSQEANQIKQYKELSQQLEYIENILKMEKKNFTSYLNQKRSADDKRPTARATGYVGAVILVLTFCCIVLLDIARCLN